MKYLYYTLYLFFVKIIHLEKQYPPIINITAVISILFSFLVFSLVNAYQYDLGYSYPKYSTIIPFVVYLILWWILYNYYKTRETELLEKIDKKHLWIKVIIVVFSVLFIMLVVKLWMYDGMTDVYEFVKKHFNNSPN